MRMVTNMGIRSDLTFIAIAIVGLILFQKQIGSAFAGAGGSLGGAISGGLSAFAESITAGFPKFPSFETTFTQETDPADFPTEQPLPAVCECGSVISQDASGNVTQQCISCPAPPIGTTPPTNGGSFFDPIKDFFDSIINPLPTVEAEPSPTGTDFSVDIFEGGLGGTESGEPVVTIIPPNPIGGVPNDFEGGGIGFEGGFIFPTPIIDPSNPPVTSGDTFIGLTPEEIFKLLVGGDISNF